MSRKLSIAVVLLGVIVMIVGIVYIYQGISKTILVRDGMRDERVTYLLPREEVEKGNIVDTAEEAQKVADTIKAHRRTVATTYDDLLKGGQYDPANPQHVIYTQAINLENYLYMAVLAYGLTTVVLTSGITLSVIGLSLILIGLVLNRLGRSV
ncbi:hypothetical protein ACFLXL_01200 [Chloroflexota bacterium]